jgi:3-phosphoshikimate 1-carboxyvinyltransferase
MRIIKPFLFHHQIEVSASKSYAQRALLAALFATEGAKIHRSGEANDTVAFIECLKQFGCSITKNSDYLEIKTADKFLDSISLNVNESGLALRMLGVAALHFTENLTLNGQGTLLKRDQSHLVKVLSDLGFSVHSGEFLPIQVSGKCNNWNISVNAFSGSQVLSGLVYFFGFSGNHANIQLTALTSRPYLEMTIQFLNELGLNIEFEEDTIRITPVKPLNFFEYSVEADWSGAANFIVGAVLSGKVTLKGLNQESKQADRKILEVLSLAGVDYQWEQGLLTVEQQNAFGFEVNLTEAPDLFPIVAVLAACSKGKSILVGTNRLLNKESNRLLSIQTLLHSLGVRHFASDNTLEIFGTNHFRGGVEVDTFHDHRIAMAATIAATRSENNLILNDDLCVSKSYPAFYEQLNLI